MLTIHKGNSSWGSSWGGELIVSRELFNPTTKQYIHIEAHEYKKDNSSLGECDLKDGEFKTAFWTEEGNDPPEGFDGPMNEVVRKIISYPLPEGYVEMSIPAKYYL